VKKKAIIKNLVLRTWVSLNVAMLDADEKYCKALLKEELAGRKRVRFILRIHSRLNKVRAKRERGELRGKV
jgi:hypothetical protein